MLPSLPRSKVKTPFSSKITAGMTNRHDYLNNSEDQGFEGQFSTTPPRNGESRIGTTKSSLTVRWRVRREGSRRALAWIELVFLLRFESGYYSPD